MVNQVILDYLRKYSGMYLVEDLKKNIISAGYSPEDVEEAARALELTHSIQTNKSFEKKVLDSQAFDKKLTKKGFKWMKFAGIIGILFLIFGILSSIAPIILPFYMPNLDATAIEKISSFLSNPLFIVAIVILSLLFLLFSIVFYKGFAKMGKVCESKLLRISSKIFIFTIILTLILGLMFIVLLMIFGNNFFNSLLGTGNTGGGLSVGAPTASVINLTQAYLNSFGILRYVLIIGTLLLILINTILFFIGLIKVGKKARFAKIAGIFGLILFLISIGFSVFLGLLFAVINSAGFGVFFIASILLSLGCLVLLFMTLSLFDASRKFERN